MRNACPFLAPSYTYTIEAVIVTQLLSYNISDANTDAQQHYNTIPYGRLRNKRSLKPGVRAEPNSEMGTYIILPSRRLGHLQLFI